MDIQTNGNNLLNKVTFSKTLSYQKFCLNIFEARLIPLNKERPNKPKIHQFRPIIVLSAMYKFIELRFLAKL